MSRSCRFSRSISVCALTLLALCQAVSAGPVALEAPEKLVDVKDAPGAAAPNLNDGDQTWTMSWDDLGLDEDVSTSSSAGSQSFARINVTEPKAPPIIAAPLPPAVLSGLIGLAGVYMYKRRNRLK
jgi:hypothetical protein